MTCNPARHAGLAGPETGGSAGLLDAALPARIEMFGFGSTIPWNGTIIGTVGNHVMRRRFLSLLILLALTASSAAFSSVVYVCSMDGEARSVCCCKDQAESDADPCGPAGENCCCDVRVERHELPLATIAAKQPGPEPSLILLHSTTESAVCVPNEPAVGPSESRPPPDFGPATFIQICSLLI